MGKGNFESVQIQAEPNGPVPYDWLPGMSQMAEEEAVMYCWYSGSIV